MSSASEADNHQRKMEAAEQPPGEAEQLSIISTLYRDRLGRERYPEVAKYWELLGRDIGDEVALDDRFDLVVATNVLVYYSGFEQSLVLANLAQMVRPGGLVVTNYPLSLSDAFGPPRTVLSPTIAGWRHDLVL